jgi:hypothetical protein
LSSPSARPVSAHRRRIFAKDDRTKLPSRGFPNPTPIRIRARTDVFSGERFFRGGIETRGGKRRRTIRVPAQQRKLRGMSIARRKRLTPNVCSPTHDFPLRRRKFSTIWRDIRTLKTPSTVSFIGGCSTHVSESGRRKLQRPSPNSSNWVFSNKASLRTAEYFTAPPRTISQRFSNGHHGTLLLMQPRRPCNKKGQSCQPR